MRTICFFLVAASAAFGQLDNDTLTITASRTANLQPDQASILVYVRAASTATLDDVLAALSGTGIAAGHLTGVYSFLPVISQALPTQWMFMLPVPFAKLKDTVASLAKLEQGLDQNKLALSFFVQGTQVSPALSASRPCLYTALIGDAQAQAQKVAAAVGLRVGSIVAMSDQGGSQVLVGAFTSIYLSAYILDPLTSNVPTPNPICSMTVQFKLLR